MYRALVAATLDRERALDGLHDAFEEGMRHPPADDRNLEGWLYRVALRTTRRGIFRGRREAELPDLTSDDPTAAIVQRLEVGRPSQQETGPALRQELPGRPPPARITA